MTEKNICLSVALLDRVNDFKMAYMEYENLMVKKYPDVSIFKKRLETLKNEPVDALLYDALLEALICLEEKNNKLKKEV